MPNGRCQNTSTNKNSVKFIFLGMMIFGDIFGGPLKNLICFGCLMSKKGLFLIRFGNFGYFWGVTSKLPIFGLGGPSDQMFLGVQTRCYI